MILDNTDPYDVSSIELTSFFYSCAIAANAVPTMTYYQHRFDRVEDYLHHRPPYLLVDEIRSVDEHRVVTRMTVKPDAFYVTGHFPGAPVFPGAMMQELTTQSAGILIAASYNPMASFDTHDPMHNEYALGVLVRVKDARYRGFVRPGDRLTATVTLKEIVSNLFEFAAQVQLDDGQTVTRNAFQLMNIPSQTLRG